MPPVDPDHEYVDKSHPLTKKDNTYRYGCWTTDSSKDRTGWLDINCPHEARAKDPLCEGCGLQLLPTKKG